MRFCYQKIASLQIQISVSGLHVEILPQSDLPKRCPSVPMGWPRFIVSPNHLSTVRFLNIHNTASRFYLSPWNGKPVRLNFLKHKLVKGKGPFQLSPPKRRQEAKKRNWNVPF